jgi:hypothetical protein
MSLLISFFDQIIDYFSCFTFNFTLHTKFFFSTIKQQQQQQKSHSFFLVLDFNLRLLLKDIYIFIYTHVLSWEILEN